MTQTASGLDGIAKAIGATKERGLPPVHLWNPPFCGNIDMRIAANGLWFYMKTPIGRPAMVKLFSTVLKKEDGKYFLVTPVEKVGITVDDAPFTAVEMRQEESEQGPALAFRTNVDDWVRLDAAHPLRFEQEAGTDGLKPYLHVRSDLWALVSRPLFYDLVSLGTTRLHQGRDWFGIDSAGEFFPMMEADKLAELS